MSSVLTVFNFFVWSIIFLVVMVKLIRSVRIVPQRHAFIVERLGKYHTTLQSGFHLLLPFLDKVVVQLDLKEETIDVPPQECFTKDEVKVMVDGVIYISVVDPSKACYGVIDYRNAAMQLAQTTTRSVIGQLSLDKTFEEREHMSAKVVEVLEQTGLEWGIRVHRYEIKNIQPPQTVHESMEKQVTAERDRKAIIARSQGERESRINRSEGAKKEMVNKSEGEKQRRINEAEGRASEIRALADATAASIEKIAEAISVPGGATALKLQLAEDYLNQIAGLANKDTDVLLPMDLTQPDTLLRAVDLEK